MKKKFLLLASLILTCFSGNAQFAITSVSILPANPVDTLPVQAVVSSVFSAGGCPLTIYNVYVANDTARLFATYQIGMLAVICNTTDTFNLGTLPCTVHVLKTEVIGTGSATGTYVDYHPLNINCTLTGIPSESSESRLSVFPNPAADELVIKNMDEAIIHVTLWDMIGSTFYIENKSFSEDQTRRLDISSLVPGMYMIRIETKNAARIFRFVKAK